MGSKSVFVKSQRSRQFKVKSQRQRRTEEIRSSRREEGRDVAVAKVEHVSFHRHEPNEEQCDVMGRQLATAARVRGASQDLQFLIRKASGCAPSQKRSRDDEEVSSPAATDNAFLLRVCEAVTPDISALATDELGAQVLAVLMKALHQVGETERLQALVQSIVSIQSPDASKSTVGFLSEHHIARAVLWGVVEFGTDSHKQMVWNAISPNVVETACHRHGSKILLKLMQHYPAAGLEIVAAILPSIQNIILDPIGAVVAEAVVAADSPITDKQRASLVESLKDTLPSLLTDKRGQRFVMAVLSATSNSDVSTTVLSALPLETVKTMCTDSRGNFLIQKLVACGAAAQEHVLNALSGSLLEASLHPIGTHVVVALFEKGEKKTLHRVTSELRPHVMDLVGSRHGSLVVRAALQKVDASLLKGLDLTALMYDPNGNLVVQELLRAMPVAERVSFFRKYVQDDIEKIAYHAYASHVLYTLLDLVDPKVQVEAIAALLPHQLELSKHVNGRFVVERMIEANKESRNLLVQNFVNLSFSKGTHFVLLKLYSVLDEPTKKKLASDVAPSAAQMACDSNATLVLQKLLQADRKLSMENKKASTPMLDSVRAALKPCMSQIAQDFFGKFVVNQL